MNYDIDRLVHIIIGHTGLDRDEALYLIEDISKEFEQRLEAAQVDAVVMRSVYFDIPNSEMTYATYSTKAYFDEHGWFLIDCDGKKQYEDEKWLRVSPHCA